MILLAIGFVHPALLGGLALASLPVLIHILNRRRFKTMEWAAMDFLLKAAVRNRRRIRLENLILLALRVLLVALLILVVARPFTEKGSLAALFAGEGALERIVLLDDSHSMRAGAGNHSAFDAGKDLVKAMVARLHEERSGDRVTIVLGSDPRGGDDRFARVAVAGAHSARLLERLETLRPSDGSLDAAGAVDAILKAFDEKSGRLLLHVVSDFRRRDWIAADGALEPRIAAALARFRGRGEVRLVDVGGEVAQNVGVTALALRERAAVAGVPVHLVATVRNHGPDPVSHLSVTFRVGDRAHPPQRLEATLRPGEEAQIVREMVFRTEGMVPVSAEVATDVLPGDDVRRHVVAVRRKMRFLLVDGETSPEPFRGETDYLAVALAPPGSVSSGVEVDVVPERAFSGRELSSVDGVFLCNVYKLPPERIQKLEEFVKGGGGLVFFLGDQVDPQEYNALFYGTGEAAGKRLLPLPLGDVEGSTDDYTTLAAPAADHPVIRFLRGMNDIVLRTMTIERWVRCEQPLPGSEARVILRYGDDQGSPALAEKGFGEGRVLLFTTAADTEWSNLPLSPLYLAMLQEIAAYVVKPDPADATRRVGEPIEIPFDPARMRRRGVVRLPDEQGATQSEMVLAQDPETHTLSFRHEKTRVAGFYLARFETPEGEELTLPFARNVEPGEGDLARLDPRRLADALPGARLERAGAGALLDGGAEDRSEFWRTLLLLLLACAVLETFLAWRFGHHATSRLADAGKQVFVR